MNLKNYLFPVILFCLFDSISHAQMSGNYTINPFTMLFDPAVYGLAPGSYFLKLYSNGHSAESQLIYFK